MSKAKVEVEEETSSTEVATSSGTAVATSSYGAGADRFAEDSKAQDNSEIKIPFLKILQDGSSEVENQQPKGCKAGDLYNSATGEVFGGEDGVRLVTVYRQHCFVEWKPIKSGGGKVTTYAIDDEIVKRCEDKQEFGKYRNPNEVEMIMEMCKQSGSVPDLSGCNEIIETFYIWGILVNPKGTYDPVLISITSTKIKAWRDWVKMALNAKIVDGEGNEEAPPFFAHQINFSTWTDNNDFGDFQNIKITPLVNDNFIESLADPDSRAFKESLKMREGIANGLFVVDDLAEREVNSGGAKSFGGAIDPDGDDVPF